MGFSIVVVIIVAYRLVREAGLKGCQEENRPDVNQSGMRTIEERVFVSLQVQFLICEQIQVN